MNITKLLAFLSISTFFSVSSHATTIINIDPWGNPSLNPGIQYYNDYEMINKFFDAQVSHSLVGHQRLYFQDYYYNTNKNICKYESSIPSSTTMIFNGQAVKMARWCRKFTVTGQYYYSFTPETDRGYFYVVNLFKTSTSPVKIQFNDDTFYFPVRGFTKAWNSAGGNAI